MAVADDLSTGARANVNAAARLHVADLRAPELLRIVDATRPDAVVHLAAQAAVSRSVADPVFDASVNILGKTLFDDGQWVHLAATSEGAAIKLYYNGQLDVEGVKSGAASTVPAPLGIGHAMHHKGLIGMLDDVRVYRRALSPEEIRALYLSGR